jgi:SAM-dependent methyltransferase
LSAREGGIDGAVRQAMTAVDRRVAADDTMYLGNDPHYFGVAASALKMMLLALETAGRATPRRILDHGCGYGRIMRALRAAFPDAELLAYDVDAGGVAHCVAAFGARPIGGANDAIRLADVRDVDLLWCGSVLTHLEAARWPAVLGDFAGMLAEGGIAVLTTHGRAAAGRMEQAYHYGLPAEARAAVLASYREHGFGYRDLPGFAGYGIAVSSASWVLQQVAGVPGLRVIGYVEAGWDGHQDVLSLARDADRLPVLHDSGGT